MSSASISPISRPFLLLTGPVYISSCLVVILWGMLVVQYEYYRVSFKSDHAALRFTALVIFVLGTGSACCVLGAAYTHLVEHWGDFSSAAVITKWQTAFCYIGSTATVIVQLFLAWRTDLIVGKRWITVIIAASAIFSFLAAYGAGIATSVITSLTGVGKLKPLIACWYGFGLVSDIAILIALTTHFRSAKTGFSKSDDIMTRMTTMSLQTGLMPTIFAAGSLICFLPGSPKMGALYLCFILGASNVYTCCFFSIVNSRPSDGDRRLSAQALLANANLGDSEEDNGSVHDLDRGRSQQYTTKQSFGPGQYAMQMLQPQAAVLVARTTECVETGSTAPYHHEIRENSDHSGHPSQWY